MTTSAEDKRDPIQDELSHRNRSQADRGPLDLIQATLPEHIEQTRCLFLEYGRSLGFSLCFQSFEEELKTLPGAYGPSSGRCCLPDQRPMRPDALRCANLNPVSAR